MTERLHLPRRYREQLEALLREHVPDVEVWAYGSRISGKSHEGSDLDLVVRGPGLEPLGSGYYDLLEALQESNIPILVQAHDWAHLPDSFHREIERDYVIVQEGAASSATTGWREVELGTVVDLELSSVDKKSKANEEPVRLCNYTDVYYNSFIHAGMEFMSATATQREIERCLLRPGDVIITKDSEKHDDIGVPALVRDDVSSLVCGYHLAILRPRQSEIDGAYLFYALRVDKAQQQFHSYANGITRFGLRKADIGLVQIPLPPLPEQRAIAHILGTLDDKIELNRRMSETLEEMARALFKSWFVDFDPVRAKVADRDTGLPSDVAALFPERLMDSELGPIPEGWEVRSLGEMAHLNPESWSKTKYPASVEYVDLANTKWGVIESTQHFSWKDAPSRARRVLRSGDTIIGTVRPGNGSYSLIGNDGLTGSTGFAVLRPLHPRFRELIYLSATAFDNIEWLAHRADGAAYPAVRPEVVSEAEVAIPAADTRVLAWFSETVGAFLDKIESAKAESRVLSVQRDVLLPWLVSGEVRVGEG